MQIAYRLYPIWIALLSPLTLLIKTPFSFRSENALKSFSYMTTIPTIARTVKSNSDKSLKLHMATNGRESKSETQYGYIQRREIKYQSLRLKREGVQHLFKLNEKSESGIPRFNLVLKNAQNSPVFADGLTNLNEHLLSAKAEFFVLFNNLFCWSWKKGSSSHRHYSNKCFVYILPASRRHLVARSEVSRPSGEILSTFSFLPSSSKVDEE
uniref:Uncharacterized protein n=1 Tax=Glossina austeni TaxID=7395 RepID=A0A1A9V435_GLOAU